MPQSLAQQAPIQGGAGLKRAEIIMQGLGPMVEAYTKMASIASANQQNAADNATRANIASASMQNETMNRAMALRAQAESQQAEMENRNAAIEAEFNNRMAIRQMELSLPEQMDMMRQRQALASIDKEMGPGGTLSKEDGMQLRAMIEQGLTAKEARATMHGMKMEEMQVKRADAMIARQQKIEDDIQKFNARSFFDRTVKEPNPELYYQVKQKIDSMPFAAALPDQAKEQLIRKELEATPGGMTWMIQERRPDGSVSFKPWAESSGAASQLQFDELKNQRQVARFEHIRNDWFKSNDAAMAHAQKMIDRSIKAGQGAEGEKNTSPYLDPDSPRTQAALEKYRQDYLKQNGMQPTWPQHLAMYENKQAGRPEGAGYEPKQGEPPLGKPFNLAEPEVFQKLNPTQKATLTGINTAKNFLDSVPGLSPQEREHATIWLNTGRELLAAYGDKRNMPPEAYLQYDQAQRNWEEMYQILLQRKKAGTPEPKSPGSIIDPSQMTPELMQRFRSGGGGTVSPMMEPAQRGPGSIIDPSSITPEMMQRFRGGSQ